MRTPPQPQPEIPERPKMSTGEEDGEFQRFDNVPVFDAHTGDDGVIYDEQLLTQIADNMNRRIADTGDYVPLVIQHTGDEDAPPEFDPPVVGFAGPFHVDTIGRENPRPAIYTSFWVFSHKVDVFRQYPRRSVEIWPEDAPEDRYFDPIALLGAETPKRDLGLIYAKGTCRNGKRPVRYEASFASGTNSFIPSGDNRKKHYSQEQGAGQMADAFSPQQLDQLTEVIRSVATPMIDEALMGGDAGGGGAPPLPDPGLGGPPEMAPDLGGDLGGDPAMGAPPDMDDDTKSYMAGMYRKFRKYAKEDGGFDELGAGSFLDTLDEEETGQMGQYMKYECSDSEMKQQYSKMSGADISEEDQPKVVDQYKKRLRKASGDARQSRIAAERYKKERDVAKAELAVMYA